MSFLETVILAIIITFVAAIIGMSYSAITKQNDTKVEKIAEEIVEYELESALHLSHGTLKDAVDLDVNPETANESNH